MKSTKELLRQARIEHVECEDKWYSCPEAPGGCWNDALELRCNCGSDNTNECLEQIGDQIDIVTAFLQNLLTDVTPRMADDVADRYDRRINELIRMLAGNEEAA